MAVISGDGVFSHVFLGQWILRYLRNSMTQRLRLWA